MHQASLCELTHLQTWTRHDLGGGNRWSVAVDLPPGTYEFKLLAALGDTGEPVEWEAGDNRQLTARAPGGWP